MSQKTIKHEGSALACTWLVAALEKEHQKYAICPANHSELVDECIALDSWGFVLAGYNLLELSFKLQLHQLNLLHQRLQWTHSLTLLFNGLPSDKQEILAGYYDDFPSNGGRNNASFPFTSIEEFLNNQDGDRLTGSLDWRYFLVEEEQSQEMPQVSIGSLQETIHASNRIVEHLCNRRRDSSNYTYCQRIRRRHKPAWISLKVSTGQQKEN